ncbi:MAG: MBL fold metallo-hydrolase [Eubacterium sp.]|jgi:phosphoribosyl 1,2-cyclic phosphodiesterase|nr:ribonuclease Z [Clostridium sp. CAG:167]
MQLYSIASGSSGNCIYLGEEDGGILIDAGISRKRIVTGLERKGLSLDDIKAIFITHEHSDHISGLGPVLRKNPIPVYATADTVSAIWEKTNMNNISPELFHSIRPEEEIEAGEMLVRPFSISHDAVDPVCYTVEKQGKRAAVATDMGCFDDTIIRVLGQCDSVLIEANHDINMLQVGPYPYSLKMRILGNKGHLSNTSCADLIKEILHKDLKHLVLGHLSRENNFPQLAYRTVLDELEKTETWGTLDTRLMVASRDEPTELLKIN